MGALVDAVTSNDYKATLEALNKYLAESIEERPPGRELAALSKRLRDGMVEYNDLVPDEAPATDFDRLRAKVGGR